MKCHKVRNLDLISMQSSNLEIKGVSTDVRYGVENVLRG
jgi:hypothetical protein